MYTGLAMCRVRTDGMRVLHRVGALQFVLVWHLAVYFWWTKIYMVECISTEIDSSEPNCDTKVHIMFHMGRKDVDNWMVISMICILYAYIILCLEFVQSTNRPAFTAFTSKQNTALDKVIVCRILSSRLTKIARENKSVWSALPSAIKRYCFHFNCLNLCPTSRGYSFLRWPALIIFKNKYTAYLISQTWL